MGTSDTKELNDLPLPSVKAARRKAANAESSRSFILSSSEIKSEQGEVSSH